VPKPLIDLKSANENPWYVLMTLFGEQVEDDIDQNLHKKNAHIWNSFIGAVRTGQHSERIKKTGLEFNITGEPATPKDEISGRYRDQWLERHVDTTMIPSMPNPNSNIDLSGTIFKKLVSVNNMYFLQMLNFSGSKFKKDASFIECLFIQKVDLSKVEIAGDTHFFGSSFLSDFVAKDMKVCGSLIAKKVVVDGGLDLSNCQVTGPATLEQIQIEGRTTVVNSNFEAGCNFDDSKFNGEARFGGAVFKGDTGFKSATFVNKTEFISAQFHGNATFNSSIFEKELTIRNAVFNNRADFPRVQFKGITDFAGSKFHTYGTADKAGIRFTDAIFSKSTSFRQCLFAHSYPEFTNSDIYPVTDFSVDEALWPSGITFPKKEARESCGIIRNLLTKKGLTEDQHFFFRREMMFTSHHEALIRRIPYQIYRCLSDYGHSIARPLLWITGVWIVGWAALWGHFSGLCFEAFSADLRCWTLPPTQKPEWNGLTAAGVSFSNLFPLYGFGRVFFKEVLETLPPALKFFSGLQTVISLPLLFFLGLGLRQRFRLR
jgi:uncharacterized protein YjbI with pentapeptide repeats